MSADDSISWDQLLELVARLDAGQITEAAVRLGDVSVELSKNGPLSRPGSGAPVATADVPVVQPPATAAPAAESTPQPASAPPAERAGTVVAAPIIGIFYRSPSPGADPFAAEGEEIAADQTIGIIEVMKMMNPVTAGVAGRVRSFVVADGEAVEFGQPLAYVDVLP